MLGKRVRLVGFGPPFNGRVGTVVAAEGDDIIVEIPPYDHWVRCRASEVEVLE